jgi:hypothetical protein
MQQLEENRTFKIRGSENLSYIQTLYLPTYVTMRKSLSFVVQFLVFEDRVLLALADLKFMIFLPQPPECWDYRCVLPYLTKINIFIVCSFTHLGLYSSFQFL